MFSGIIVIAVAHGMLLTPALLAECRFVYGSRRRHQKHNASTKTTTMTTMNNIDGNRTTTMSGIGMEMVSDIGRRKTQIDDESESDE